MDHGHGCLGDCNQDAEVDEHFLQRTDETVCNIAHCLPVSFLYGEHHLVCDDEVMVNC
jgi:hypothetical protein